ncbi:YidC/Oxa1 family membrane protein insertase [Dolosigranulum pigrum]
MTELQPEIEALKEKYSATDSKTKEKLQEETQKLYDEHGVNPLMGCLPMLIQMPIFIAVYSAVSRTPELATGSFLWVNLGQPDPYYILPLLAGLFMFANTYLMQMGRDNSGMGGKVMSIVMPAFIILITVNLSSGLALYFVASNIFAVIQTLVFNNPFKKRREAKEEAERKAAEEQRRKRAIKKAKKYGRNIKK